MTRSRLTASLIFIAIVLVATAALVAWRFSVFAPFLRCLITGICLINLGVSLFAIDAIVFVWVNAEIYNVTTELKNRQESCEENSQSLADAQKRLVNGGLSGDPGLLDITRRHLQESVQQSIEFAALLSDRAIATRDILGRGLMWAVADIVYFVVASCVCDSAPIMDNSYPWFRLAVFCGGLVLMGSHLYLYWLVWIAKIETRLLKDSAPPRFL